MLEHAPTLFSTAIENMLGERLKKVFDWIEKFFSRVKKQPKTIRLIGLATIICIIPEVYSEFWQTSKMDLFTKIVNGLKSLIIFRKSSI